MSTESLNEVDRLLLHLSYEKSEKIKLQIQVAEAQLNTLFLEQQRIQAEQKTLVGRIHQEYNITPNDRIQFTGEILRAPTADSEPTKEPVAAKKKKGS